MANASELLNFIKQDRDLNRITLDAQDILAHLVQMAFKSVCVWLCWGMWGWHWSPVYHGSFRDPYRKSLGICPNLCGREEICVIKHEIKLSIVILNLKN